MTTQTTIIVRTDEGSPFAERFETTVDQFLDDNADAFDGEDAFWFAAKIEAGETVHGGGGASVRWSAFAK